MNLLLNRWIIGFTLKYTRGLSSLNTAKFWTLNKAIVLVLIGGFGVLLVEVRFDHRFVVGEDTVGWIPIFYSIMMMVASLIGLFFWRRGGRQVLFVGFLLAIFVGLAGFWFHTNARLIRSVQHEFSAWVRKIPDEDRPPALAPLAFFDGKLFQGGQRHRPDAGSVMGNAQR